MHEKKSESTYRQACDCAKFLRYGLETRENFSPIWNLESGLQLQESGSALTIGIQNPTSTDKDWNRLLESRTLDCLKFPNMSQKLKAIIEKFLWISLCLYSVDVPRPSTVSDCVDVDPVK